MQKSKIINELAFIETMSSKEKKYLIKMKKKA